VTALPQPVTGGAFGCLAAAAPEHVLDAVVGPVGSRVPEDEALERLGWVRGLSADERPALRAEALAYFDLGLVRAILVDGARHWQRVRARRMDREERERARLRAAQLAAEDAARRDEQARAARAERYQKTGRRLVTVG
jgi:hypothetical protein